MGERTVEEMLDESRKMFAQVYKECSEEVDRRIAAERRRDGAEALLGRVALSLGDGFSPIEAVLHLEAVAAGRTDYQRMMKERAEAAEAKLQDAISRNLGLRDDVRDADNLAASLRLLVHSLKATASAAADMLRAGEPDEALALLESLRTPDCAA